MSSSSGGLADPPPAVGYLQLIRTNRNFRRLWSGHVVSLLGDWFNFVATAALLTAFTDSGLAVAALFVVRMLAPFIVSPVAGVLADRMDRRRLMVATDIFRAVVVLGFLLVRGPEQVWLLYTLTFLQMGASGFFMPARNAILPDLVSRRELGAANALSAATWSVMLAFGSALGGLVAGAWGTAPAFAIDSATFVVSAFLVGSIRGHSKPAPPAGGGGFRAAAKEYFEGLAYLRKNLDILLVASVKAANSLIIVGGFGVSQIFISERYFVLGEGGSTGLGLMLATLGVGTGLGPIAARAVTGDRRRSLRLAIAIGFLVSGLGLLIVSTLRSFPVVLLGTLLRGIGAGTGWVFSTALLLRLLPNRVRGRVFSFEFAMFTLMNAIGAAAGGWALDRGGFAVPGLLRLLAALCLLPAALWAAWTLWGRHATPPPTDDDPPTTPVAAVEAEFGGNPAAVLADEGESPHGG
ncbi:MFS transporter [bacterium]|nr:MFS transporter [bacterium]